jgi:hypothetical protein
MPRCVPSSLGSSPNSSTCSWGALVIAVSISDPAGLHAPGADLPLPAGPFGHMGLKVMLEGLLMSAYLLNLHVLTAKVN